MRRADSWEELVCASRGASDLSIAHGKSVYDPTLTDRVLFALRDHAREFVAHDLQGGNLTLYLTKMRARQ